MDHKRIKVRNFDFVIVGAGSAGCVLADRLSEGGKYSILLLEAGPTDRYSYPDRLRQNDEASDLQLEIQYRP